MIFGLVRLWLSATGNKLYEHFHFFLHDKEAS